MNGLIVAGVASIAGIAGVVGLSRATTDTGPPPATPAAVSTEAPSVLAQRLARLQEAERAADAALRRADEASRSRSGGATPATRVPVALPTAAAPTRADDGHDRYDDDDEGEDRDRHGGGDDGDEGGHRSGDDE
jgi:hypothetical protein